MSIEIIREGHKPDTKLYFTCKCGCVWKADEEDCEERTIELQRVQTFKRYYYKCPTCGHNVMGQTREEYNATNAVEAVNIMYAPLKMDYSNYTGSGNPSNTYKPNYDDAHFNGEFD